MHTKEKERGQASGPMIIVLGIAALIVVLFLLALAPKEKSDIKPNPSHHSHLVHGKFLKPRADGKVGYAYQSVDGVWWIYWMMLDNQQDYRNLGTLPPRGTWEKSPEAPEEDEVLSQQDESVTESESGYEVENQSVEPESSPEAAPAESAPSDSGSGSGSDSGGGDGGGGDGGGGDGGSSD